MSTELSMSLHDCSGSTSKASLLLAEEEMHWKTSLHSKKDANMLQYIPESLYCTVKLTSQ